MPSVAVRLRIPALGGAWLDAEVEIPEAALAPRQESDTLTDAELRERWRCSARTLKRLRDRRLLPFEQPTPRTFLYRLEDVREHERTHRQEIARRLAR